MHSVFYLCSALDEETKHLRSITTDSPAATKKVFGLCKALQVSGVDVCILSLGRGRQNGSGAYFSRSDKEVEGIRVCYAAFWHKAILTHFVTAFSMACLLLRNSNQKNQSMLVYNRCWHYIPTLFVAKILRIRCFLDLEDGWVTTKQSLPQTLLTLFFDWACSEGSLLACDSLAEQVKTDHVLTCYGIACQGKPKVRNWQGKRLHILLGGSLSEGTGALLFIQAIALFRKKYPLSCHELHVVVVGFGEMANDLECFAIDEADGMVEFRGSVSNDSYQKLLGESQIGLCLKLVSGPFHDSTFPSKVIELAAHELLLVSTAVSDVPKLFSSGNALLLPEETPEALADALYWAVNHRTEAALMARRGRENIVRCCSPEKVGSDLVDFLTVKDAL